MIVQLGLSLSDLKLESSIDSNREEEGAKPRAVENWLVMNALTVPSITI